MVTGASTADVAVILLDARKGVVEQTRRHSYIAAILAIPHVVVAVNKMDLVDFSAERFAEIEADLQALSDAARPPRRAGDPDVGAARRQRRRPRRRDALVRRARRCSSTSRRSRSPATATSHDRRFPVQWVIRPMTDEHHDYRGYAGEIAGGVWRAGDEVVVLPSGAARRVAAVETLDGDARRRDRAAVGHDPARGRRRRRPRRHARRPGAAADRRAAS